MSGQYDLVVIGGGSAGLTASIIAGTLGARVLLVDKTRLGGDCLWTGCVPSKALIRCARAAYEARHLGRFGVHVDSVRTDFRQALDYVHDVIETIAHHDSPESVTQHGVEVAFGGARFIDENTLQIGADRMVKAAKTIICVGAHGAPPPIPGLADVDALDNTSLFSLPALPPRLVVIGAGPIGLEMGQSFARFGSKVTVLELADRILRHDDAELAELLAGRLGVEFTLRLGIAIERIETDFVRLKTGETVPFDRLLVAAGRRPQLSGLGLEAAGVELHRGLIKTDSRLRTSAPTIWAAGDCVGPYQFTHTAEAQAQVAVRNALFIGSTQYAPKAVPWVTYTDPELAHVGLTEASAREQHGDIRVYRYPYERLDRALCEGDDFGLAKLVADPKGRILGASILGHAAGEAISNVVLAMNSGTRVDALAGQIFAYPTMSRIVRRVSSERFFAEKVPVWQRRWFGQFEGRD